MTSLEFPSRCQYFYPSAIFCLNCWKCIFRFAAGYSMPLFHVTVTLAHSVRSMPSQYSSYNTSNTEHPMLLLLNRGSPEPPFEGKVRRSVGIVQLFATTSGKGNLTENMDLMLNESFDHFRSLGYLTVEILQLLQNIQQRWTCFRSMKLSSY